MSMWPGATRDALRTPALSLGQLVDLTGSARWRLPQNGRKFDP